MSTPPYETLSDAELLEEARKLKQPIWGQAFFIGFLFGIILFSIFNQSWGWFLLIPLFLIRHLSRNELSKKKSQLDRLLKERGLKA